MRKGSHAGFTGSTVMELVFFCEQIELCVGLSVELCKSRLIALSANVCFGSLFQACQASPWLETNEL